MNVQLSEEELKISTELYNKRIEYLIKLGEIKLSEINNEKEIEKTYFNITELNTRKSQFMNSLHHKYGEGNVDITSGLYIKK